ncbi:TlpA family protein disulfide reductase [Flavobacteriaceae bacterium AU392]|nr:TlpA family protein disulfide reductase [Flavobacteriaceae bacterium]RKM85921.1 TlpA family protein disulfide reductase [Flavobacteriaceae bacterium AU392]
MEKIVQIIGEYAFFFDHYGNYVLIPLFIVILITDWKVSKLNFSNLKKKILRTSLSISAIILGALIYMTNFSLKPMISSLAKVDNAIGTEMVHFEYLNVANNEIETLEDHNGKIVLLNFWGTFCPPCIKEFPDLKKLETQFSEDLVVIAISDENSEKIKQFILKIESPSIIGMQKNYQWINPEKFLPLSVIIDRGKIKERFFGRKTYKNLVEIIEQVKKEH